MNESGRISVVIATTPSAKSIITPHMAAAAKTVLTDESVRRSDIGSSQYGQNFAAPEGRPHTRQKTGRRQRSNIDVIAENARAD